MLRQNIFFLTLGILFDFFMLGCTSTKILKPELIEMYKDHDVTVNLKTGEKVSFKKGQFLIRGELGDQCIEGRGMRYDEKKSFFEGKISFSEIQSVNVNSISNTRIVTVAVLCMVTVSIVYFLIHLNIDING